MFRIAQATPRVARMITGAMTLGRMCRTMICRSRQPTTRAAST